MGFFSFAILKICSNKFPLLSLKLLLLPALEND